MGGGSGRERVWFQDVRGFLRDDRVAKILPEPRAPLAEQLNAVMRFALYYGAVLLVLRRSYAALYVPLVAAGVTYLVYAADASERAGRRESMAALDLADDQHTGRPCTRPTRDNPFMNVLPTDYRRNPARPGACDLGNSSVARRAEALHAHNLYRDSDDVYGRRASSRAFYATPSTTIPNDQAGFADWLYGGPRRTCKEEGGGDQCALRLHARLGAGA